MQKLSENMSKHIAKLLGRGAQPGKELEGRLGGEGPLILSPSEVEAVSAPTAESVLLFGCG